MRWLWASLVALCGVGAAAWWLGGETGTTAVDAGPPPTTGPTQPTQPTPPLTPATAPTPTPTITATSPAVQGASLPLGLDAVIPAATVAPGHVSRTAAGALSCDGRYEVAGDGTREHPYLLSWELLTSAEDSYVPRLGMSAIPQRVALLQGSWVTVSGYIAFPLVATETDEVLLMLNQWDGCCIGVPPTPYDAVEVRLDHAIEIGKRHQIQYATITGKLEIDPYVVDKWLVGLYLMEDASLTMDM